MPRRNDEVLGAHCKKAKITLGIAFFAPTVTAKFHSVYVNISILVMHSMQIMPVTKLTHVHYFCAFNFSFFVLYSTVHIFDLTLRKREQKTGYKCYETLDDH